MYSRGVARQPGRENGFEFGRFRLDPAQNILWRDSQVLPLGPKVVQTLSILVANPGQVISREELIRQIWSDTAVEDSNLAHNISVLRRSLREDPSCNYTIETVPRRGYRFCQSRPAIAEVPAPLALPRPVAVFHSSAPAPSQRNYWLGLLAAFGLLVCLGAVGMRLVGLHSQAKLRNRRSIAVVGFANLSQGGDSAWLSPALSEMMTTELGAGGQLLTIPDENVARARNELRLADRNGFSRGTLGRLRRNLNADLVVSGAYTVLPPKAEPAPGQAADPQVRLDLRVQDAATGESVDALSEIGSQSDLFDVIARAGERVRHDLGVEVVAAADAEQARMSVSANPQALRLYAQGVAKLETFDPLGARDLLQRAVAADPDFPLAQSELAEAWMMLGYDQRAAESARAAFQLSGKLGLEQKLLIEGRYGEASHQWSQAVTAYRTLFDAYPDNLEYGLRLTRAQRLAARYPDAEATIRALRALPAPASNDPRIDLEETMAEISSGDVAAAQRSAGAAERKGRERGSGLLIAQAKLIEPVSHLPKFVSDQEDARQICQIAGNTDCVGQAWLRIGQSLNPQNAARGAIEQAMGIFHHVGDERRFSEAQSALGVFFMDRGDFAEARRQYAAARASCDTIGDRSCITKQIINEGNIDYASGDVAAAEKKYREALALARQSGEDQLVWGSLNNIASLLSDYDGSLAEAESLYRELVEMDRKSGKDTRMNFTLSNLGAVITDEGRLAEAQAILNGVEDWAEKNGQRREFGSSAISLAEIDLAQERPAVAESRLEPMAKVLEDEGSTFVLYYYEYIAEAQLAQNKLAEAQQTLQHARSLMTDSNQHGFDNDYLTIIENKVVAAIHRDDRRTREESLRNLNILAVRCGKNGLIGVELQARLAEGEVEMQGGLRSAGSAHLASLERDATRKGFGLIAREASAARQMHQVGSQ